MKPLLDSVSGSDGTSSPGVVRATAATAAQRAVDHLLSLQGPKGDWEGEMVWCTMILAQSVIVRAVVGRPYGDAEKARIVQHFEHYQLADGSWGMHPESAGYVFFTTLAYVALRMLGMPAEAAMLVRARRWLHAAPGGVGSIPSWGKFWLSLLGLYGRDGLNAIPPEIFLLPPWLPFHPSRYYCHTRQIYLGIAYLYGVRFEAAIPESLRDALRGELYPESYASIDFRKLRNRVAPTDLYVPVSPLLRGIYRLLGLFERWHPESLRQRALEQCFDRILYEQRSSRYQGISPVSSLLNCLAIYARDPDHPELEPSLQGAEAWRWEDDAEGLRYVGARSNSWDTAFAVQALTEAPAFSDELSQAVRRAHRFLDRAQLREELPDDYRAYWRESAVGGWCFSDGQHRWPVSDCAAEALSALLSIDEHPELDIAERFDAQRLAEAVRFILSRQNADGGFGTYERRRGGSLLETVNPSEMYGQCMTELSYIECTSSSLAALTHYRRHYADFANREIDRASEHAVGFLRSRQLADGSYPGFWGINYTYAIFHVTKALRSTGVPNSDPALQKAACWLMEKQRADGGWGEHYRSCLEGRYVEHPQSQAVMTSWGLLALLEILPPDHDSIRRGIDWLIDRQDSAGGWPREAVNGVFFGAAMLDYRFYPAYFPAWALNRYVRLSGISP